MKYKFEVKGENNESLEKLRKKMLNSKFFQDAEGSMIMTPIKYLSQKDVIKVGKNQISLIDEEWVIEVFEH